MRILMVSSELHEKGSDGTGVYLNYLSEELVRKGHRVDVIAYIKPGSRFRGLFEVYNIGLSRLRIFGMLKWSIDAYVCSMKLMKARRYDVVSVHSPLAFVYPFLHNPDIPMVITMHIGWSMTNPRYSPITKVFSFLRDLISCRRSAKIIVLNRDFQQHLLHWGIPGEKICYVPNAVDLQKFLKKNGSREFFKRFGLGPEATILLCVGRIDRGKGVEHLLAAARIIKHNTSDPIKVIIAGDGPLRPGLTEKYADLENVVFTGFLSDEDLVSAYQESDMFVMPSEGGEGMPTVLLEAMASGLPIISTNVPGAVEIVEESFGRLVEYGNPIDLAKTISELVADKPRLKEMALAARNCAKRYDWREVAPQIVKVLNSARGEDLMTSKASHEKHT